ncbi:MAG TPA: HAD family phosphatase [Acidimicrobiia bacterium]|nr:HAD family phosphatase [Acidimicrobiia bacterium]
MSGVVFDVDGVLVDSEPHSRVAWVAALSAHGRAVTERDVEACTGFGYEATHAALTAGPGPAVPAPGELWPELLAALAASFDRGLTAFADAVDALERLAFDGVPVAVATASPRERLDLTLERAGLSRRVQVSAAGDEVEHPKPAPDVYLLAADRLGLDPHRCVAVEDTVTGARAAVAAGMRVLGVARDPEHAGGLLAAGAAVSTSVDYELLRAWLG